MSKFMFLASNNPLPEIDYTNPKEITVEEAMKIGIKPHELFPWEDRDPNDKILCFESEEDLGEVVIRKTYHFEDTRCYTKMRFIYVLEFQYSPSRARDIINYIKDAIHVSEKIEIFSVWLDDIKSVNRINKNLNELSINDIKNLYEKVYYFICVKGDE